MSNASGEYQPGNRLTHPQPGDAAIVPRTKIGWIYRFRDLPVGDANTLDNAKSGASRQNFGDTDEITKNYGQHSIGAAM